MKVRAYRTDDRQDLERVCLETCEDPALREHTELLYLKYLDYFVTEEPEHVFVLEDETDRAQGYILCCARGRRFREAWRRDFFPRLRAYGWKETLLQRHTLLETRLMEALHYPAHMRIDISPAFQRKGGGRQLLDALCSRLREEGIEGLHLGCGEANTAGNAFYRKTGFRVHHRCGGRNVYVRKIGE